MSRITGFFFGILITTLSLGAEAQVISNVDVVAYPDSAHVSFDTDSLTTTQIKYGLTSAFGLTASNPDSLTAHEYLLTALLADTVYYYRIIATDTLGNADSLDAQFATPAFPAIANLNTTGLATTAVIAFDTNVPAVAQVNYGPTTGYGSTVSVTDTLTAHELTLTGLANDTQYFYEIVATDTFSQVVTLDSSVFSISLPEISNITTVGLANTARISFETDVPTVALINYGTTLAYGSQKIVADTLTQHEVTLTGMVNNTLYYFEIVATDTLSQSVSADSSVTTTALPVISNIAYSDTTTNSIRISFDTDVPTFTSFTMRKETDFPNRWWIKTFTDSVLTTQHSIVIDTVYQIFQQPSNPQIHILVSSENYNLKVIATDSIGNTRTSSAQPFVMKAFGGPLPAPWQGKTIGDALHDGRSSYDTTSQTFSAIGQGSNLFLDKDDFYFLYQDIVGDFSLTTRINWVAGSLSNLAKAGTHFRVDTTDASQMVNHSYNYRFVDYFYYRLIQGTLHTSIVTSELQAYQGEQIWARLKRSGNTFTSEYSVDGVNWAFHGPSAGENVAIPREGMLGFISLSKTGDFLELYYDSVSVSFPADVTPPVVSNVSSQPVNNTALVSYDADEWVTTIVDYGLTTAYSDSVVVDTSHVSKLLTIDSLSFSTEYHYRIRAYDSDGNEFIAPDLTFITEANSQLPIELSTFAGTVDERSVRLSWSLESSDEVARFEVQRRMSDSFVTIGSVESSSEKNGQYGFVADGLDIGIHTFRLRLMGADGSSVFSSEIEVELTLAGPFELQPAYPNPFSSTARFALTVREMQPVKVELYNSAGQLVRVLYDGTIESNAKREFVVDGADLSGGLYFYRIKGASFNDTGKLILMK